MTALLTTAQVAAELGVRPAAVCAWIHAGELAASRIGRQWRVQRVELDRFIRRREYRGQAIGRVRPRPSRDYQQAMADLLEQRIAAAQAV